MSQKSHEHIESFKEKLLEKFGEYIIGIAVLPPLTPEQVQQQQQIDPKFKYDPKRVPLMVVVEDASSKQPKDVLHKKFQSACDTIAKDVHKNLAPQAYLLSQVWSSCYEGQYDIVRMIAASRFVHDQGTLAAIKISEVHKNLVTKQFEKYIMSYVLAGSITQGRATSESDIDVWVVIDDTDVRKMSKAELKDRLRQIIISRGVEAGEMTGIKNKLNIQCYILTDFWDSLKEANPVIFTLLRDGVPFYDRGIFMPWKQLLRAGKIKPSREAIDMFMSTGQSMLNRVAQKFKEIGMEDLYYSVLTPSQAALMLYGVPPPTPKETPEVMEDIFVKKEKMLEKKWIKILKDNVKTRKTLEHGSKKKITGTELDKTIQNNTEYLERINKLFTEIQDKFERESIVHLYDNIVTIIRDVLKLEGVDKAQDSELIKLFEDELIATSKVPAKYLRTLNAIIEAKREFDKGKLSKHDIEKAKKGSKDLVTFLIEYMQRKRGVELERAKIRIKHGEKYGEIVLLDKQAFIILDMQQPDSIMKAKIMKDGSLGTTEDTDVMTFEKALAKAKFPKAVFIKEPIFDNIKNLFGRHAEILVTR